MKTNSKTLPCLLLIVFSNLSLAATYTVPVGQWNTDGEELGLQPGDTICLSPQETGVYSVMRWKNINGSEDNPILITNCGGQAVINSTGSYGWKFENSKHFKISGNGSAAYEYGIKISATTGFYLTMESFTTNFDITQVEIAGLYENGTHEDSGFAGIGIKTRPFCDGSSNQGVWDMEDVKVYNNYIHDTGGEGLYIGHGFYQGRIENGCDVITYPHAIKGLRVFNNLIEDVGYDGIQVKNADEDAQIFNNVIKNYGTMNVGVHNEGLFVGDGSEALIYNNWVENGTGHGLQINAFGNTEIFNNVIINSVDDGMYLNNNSPSFANRAGTFKVYHNTFVNMGDDGIEAYTPQAVMIQNNIFVAYADALSTGVGTLEANVSTATVDEVSFLSAETNDFHLTSESPAAGSGVNVGLDFDYDYSTRSNSVIDAGAFAYNINNDLIFTNGFETGN